MPDAADVHALTGALDDIVDFAEEAADQLGRYGVEASMLPAQEIADVLVLASDELGSVLTGLPTASTPARTSSRSTGSRTRPTGSSARPSRRCSPVASTRWS